MIRTSPPREPLRRSHSLARPDSSFCPSKNLSADPAQDYLADGFTEEMITQLARLRPDQLAVIARATATHYKGSRKPVDRIARELKVDYLFEGSIRREGVGVRVTAQLIHASDQTHRWAQTYDRDLSNALALQSEVASAIANEIHLALTPQTQAQLTVSRALNPAAYDDYIRGRYHISRPHPEAIAQSITWFQRAVEKDPAYPLAYASLSHALALLAMVPFDVLPPREATPRAQAAASKALELDPTLPEAHAALAVVRHHYDWDWKGAEQEYQKALALNPDYAGARLRYAWLMLRFQEGKRRSSKFSAPNRPPAKPTRTCSSSSAPPAPPLSISHASTITASANARKPWNWTPLTSCSTTCSPAPTPAEAR